MKTFKEVYKMPFLKLDRTGWVYDDQNNFIFQFEDVNAHKQALILDVVNGKSKLENPYFSVSYSNGEILTNKGYHLITIRGWGNLTSPNCLGFSYEEAANIQDTLGEFLVEMINKRD